MVHKVSCPPPYAHVTELKHGETCIRVQACMHVSGHHLQFKYMYMSVGLKDGHIIPERGLMQKQDRSDSWDVQHFCLGHVANAVPRGSVTSHHTCGGHVLPLGWVPCHTQIEIISAAEAYACNKTISRSKLPSQELCTVNRLVNTFLVHEFGFPLSQLEALTGAGGGSDVARLPRPPVATQPSLANRE